MNKQFGDTHPDEVDELYRLCQQRERCQRVLTLAREIMLAQMANPDIYEFHFGSAVSLAESWIASEDAYTLPEDMQ